MDIAKYLLSIEGFETIGERGVDALAPHCRIEDFEAGEHVVRMGDDGDRMFVIVQGSVRIPVVDQTNRTQFIAYLNEGMMFGEMALLTGDPRNADVIADSRLRVISVPRAPLQSVFKQAPHFAGFLTTILGERLMQRGGVSEVGKYRLLGEIGRGGMAYVYEGIHPHLERRVAIKMLSHTLLYRRHFGDRFRTEARVIAQLRHPNIVEVYDTEERYATLFIIMEKLTGQDVEQILDARQRMEPAEVRSILRDVASALHYAHQNGIVHRDVKPSNIFITSEGVTKIMDFGIAAVEGIEQTMEQDSGMYLGTPVYSAPEHALGKPVDGRSDIYALGIVAFEMLLGNPPFDADNSTQLLLHHVRTPMPNPRELDPSLPRDLEHFILKACAKDPNDRWQSCQEVVDFFDSIEDRRTAPHRVQVRTVTFVYSPAAARDVDNLVRTVRSMADGVDGLRLHEG